MPGKSASMLKAVTNRFMQFIMAQIQTESKYACFVPTRVEDLLRVYLGNLVRYQVSFFIKRSIGFNLSSIFTLLISVFRAANTDSSRPEATEAAL